MTREEDQLRLRLQDEAGRAARTGLAVPGRFIPREEMPRAVHAARQAGVLVFGNGGREDAERVQVCFCAEAEEARYTFRWLEIRWNARFSRVEHRALLGSLMALGTDRSYMGDLIAGEDRAWLCCLQELAVRLPAEWREAGRTPLTVRLLEEGETPALSLAPGRSLRDTVASLRLDCVLASALGISRESAAEQIRRGGVQVNHRQEEHRDRVLGPGDILSVQGFGRIRLQEAGEPNRHGRLPVLLEIQSAKNVKKAKP